MRSDEARGSTPAAGAPESHGMRPKTRLDSRWARLSIEARDEFKVDGDLFVVHASVLVDDDAKTLRLSIADTAPAVALGLSLRKTAPWVEAVACGVAIGTAVSFAVGRTCPDESPTLIQAAIAQGVSPATEGPIDERVRPRIRGGGYGRARQ